VLVWGSFRYFIRLPEVIEELWFKPVLWLIPLFWWNLALKESIVMFGKKWRKSILFGFIVGLFYFFLLKYKDLGRFSLDINLIGVALATAVTEELTFSGFVVGYLEKMRKGRMFNLLITGLMTAAIRLPILLFFYKATYEEILGVVLIVLMSGIINAWIRVKTGNVAGSIVARWMLNFAALG